ncbi:MAG: bifunctional 2-C-methyl-D-erythritol 4-phosphate cytidylyltransferase/2-C-methyl-D-erythritol 2,4-cyclodiphosphate synthase [Pseudooceanicola sp.]|nr:bifunctional 2-C-methyl-D-erythritol 4-phosphate cytidylyltransferase/2-C-methyl-D-erythritol 2,4-cyclodiphosphate synthase [Pseudooceanicola sp.]
MTIAALIVAAGRGLRAGGGMPKQWRNLRGKAMVEHCLAVFAASPAIDRIALVLHPDDMDRQAAFEDRGFLVAPGGADRAASVRSGLDLLAGVGATRVLIHDAARPCVRPATIEAVLDALARGASGAAPALAVTDALWSGEDGRVTGTRDRAGLYRAQTPQGFDLAALRDAHAAHPGGAADDVEVALAHGLEVAIVPGDEANIKVTVEEDFTRADSILRGEMDVRLGNGFDVHAFGPGDHVTLCGVRVPHGQGLVGHSDADVGMHAVTDAIYGALAQGDIGRHFPPSDPQWKGADSLIFLRHAAELARAMGFRLTNVDCTLICEAPKIAPHAGAMCAAMAAGLGIEVARVSVKATTSERLGFTGRGEGIAALATATLVSA